MEEKELEFAKCKGIDNYKDFTKQIQKLKEDNQNLEEENKEESLLFDEAFEILNKELDFNPGML